MNKGELKNRLLDMQLGAKMAEEPMIVQSYDRVLHLVNQLDEPDQVTWESRRKAILNLQREGSVVVDKPVIPQFVATFIEKEKGTYNNPLVSYERLYQEVHRKNVQEKNKPIISYIRKNSTIYLHAWLYGYIVEEEEKYRVELPDPEKNSNKVVLMRTQDGRVVINKVKAEHFYEKEEVKLTEDEIKRNHEYLWVFAEEVEK